MHPNVERALEEIDAQLFSGETSEEELVVLESYIGRWVRRIPEIREVNQAVEEESIGTPE